MTVPPSPLPTPTPPKRCGAIVNVDLVLDDYDGPVPNPFQCSREPHPRTELHQATVEWFSDEDDDD